MNEGARKVVILGSGCAGLTAAIYAARASLRPLIVEGPQSGGQLTMTSRVENYPGFREGIQGPELVEEMRAQAERFGAEIIKGAIERADLGVDPFMLSIDGREIPALSVIVATGASARLLGLESEKRLLGHGVSTCATCDGFFYRDQEVVVIGGGDSALEEAIFLTKFATKVTIVHRRDQLRGSKILQERSAMNDRIAFRWNAVAHEVIGDESAGVTGLDVRDIKTGEVSRIPCQGVFVAIGHVPNTEVFRDQIELDKMGYIVTERGVFTSREGVFAAGDVADHIYRQAITAAGSGCMAAIEVERYLSERGGE
jgi:thioredoxin reductase (NADPH)